MAHAGFQQPRGKPDQAALVVAGAGHHAGGGGLRIDRHDLVGSDRRGIGWRPGIGFPEDGIGEAGDAASPIDEAGHFDTVTGLEPLDGTGGDPHAAGAVLQVHGLPGGGVDHDPFRADAVATERLRPKPCQRRDRHLWALKRRMRRWRHDAEPFRSPHPQLRLEKLPASVEDR